ncbi:hypothetical protein HJG60_008691 [Phyllostomus discolor]|uniref:Uncharacterized protein n=1 Tax=Phyllostomus discolor TaxID=89673 RepID=A0A833YZF9_9CHIR|nr:hypothetical protein HJG60_008691 [Phyllostomus discolor]
MKYTGWTHTVPGHLPTEQLSSKDFSPFHLITVASDKRVIQVPIMRVLGCTSGETCAGITRCPRATVARGGRKQRHRAGEVNRTRARAQVASPLSCAPDPIAADSHLETPTWRLPPASRLPRGNVEGAGRDAWAAGLQGEEGARYLRGCVAFGHGFDTLCTPCGWLSGERRKEIKTQFAGARWRQEQPWAQIPGASEPPVPSS